MDESLFSVKQKIIFIFILILFFPDQEMNLLHIILNNKK